MTKLIKHEAHERNIRPPGLEEWARFWGSILEWHPLNMGMHLGFCAFIVWRPTAPFST